MFLFQTKNLERSRENTLLSFSLKPLAPDLLVVHAFARLLRVRAAFFALADRAASGRAADDAPPFCPPFRAGVVLTGWPRPEPLFFPPPVILLTVAQARFSASSFGTPRFS